MRIISYDIFGFILVLFASASIANAAPQPPHDEEGNGITCVDCHVEYSGLNDPAKSTGTATAGSDTVTLYDTSKNWQVNEWVGGVVSFVSPGPDYSRFRTITSNSTNSVSWAASTQGALPTAPSVGDNYVIGKTTYLDIETKCKSCHNDTGMAMTKPDVGLHVVENGTVVGCGKCHDPHNVDSTSGQGNAIIRDRPRWAAAQKDVSWPSGNPQNDYIRGGPPYDGICEICHTNTTHHRNNDSGDHTHYADQACTDCHLHQNGFLHGAGGGGGGSCEECHGHDPGYAGLTGGAGTFDVHSTHTENDADDQRGPNINCDVCHDTSSYPRFADGAIRVQDTSVCDSCHSPLGDYDGVNDSQIGAKANWSSGGVYSNGKLIPGREAWCATCHDVVPSNSAADGSGIDAPNVIGSSLAVTPYGVGYGYYQTGHGLPNSQRYPASGDATIGADLGCDACHDATLKHIDDVARTYDRASSPGDDDDYQHGYRLRTVGGIDPLAVPRTDVCNPPEYVRRTDFMLCMECHPSEPFIDPDNSKTNFRRTITNSDPETPDTEFNAHYSHLAINNICDYGPVFSSDWSFAGYDSRATCVTCHNVHGSTQLAMVRDGSLVNREPGLELLYYNDLVSYQCGGPGAHDPTPDNVSLPDSTGTIWNSGELTGSGFCSTCHGSCGFDVYYLRSPDNAMLPWITAVYGRKGGNALAVRFSESTYTQSDGSGQLLPSDFSFTDSDDGRGIDTVAHIEGDKHAIVYLSSALDGTDDLGVDRLTAVSDSSIYDGAGYAMDSVDVIVTEDNQEPGILNPSPTNGEANVAVDTQVSFALKDDESGLDWSTFSITLVGDAGYTEVYTAADTAIVDVIGSQSYFDVVVTPDEPFAYPEEIAATVNITDLVGNELEQSWAFTTGESILGGTIVVHPSLMASNPGGYWTVPDPDQWADYLNTNDGDTTYVTSNTGASGAQLFMDMDYSSSLDGATITSITVHVFARYVSGWSPSPPCYNGNLNIGYMTDGVNTLWHGSTAISGCSYTDVDTTTFTTDSSGGPLDPTDIENLQIVIRRLTSGGYPLRITEIYLEIEYIP